MTGLKDNFDDAVYLIFVNHFVNILHTAVVRAHNRAVDIEVFFRKGIVNRHIFVNRFYFFTGTVAAVESDHICAEFLNGFDNFVTDTAVWTSCNQESRTITCFAFIISFPVRQHFFCAFLDNGNTFFEIKIKTKTVQAGTHFITADWCRIQLAEFKETKHGAAFVIFQTDSITNVFFRNGDMVKIFQFFF